MKIQGDTVERILHTATLLFAERGFAETSLRTITGMAEVNLASVNYHFGSKKILIQAVFARFFTPYCNNLDASLDTLESELRPGQSLSLEVLVKCILDTLLKSTLEIDENPQKFMRLVSLAYAQSQEHLRQYIVSDYGATYRRFTKLLRLASPELNPVELYWRMYFMLGAAVFTVSSFDSIRAILNADYQADTEYEDVIKMMISPIIGMLKSSNA